MPEDSPYDFAPEQKPPEPPRHKPNSPESPFPSSEKMREHTCPHCGFKSYAKPRARCPECSAPLDASLTDLLQFSNTSWVRSNANGSLLLALAILLHITAVSIGWTGRWVPGAIVHLLAALLATLGIFLATKKEPDLPNKSSPTALPARIAATLTLLLWSFALLVTIKQLYPYWKPAIILILLGYIAVSFTLGFHLQKIAIRIPNDSLAAHLLNLAWILPAMCLLIICLYLFNLANPAHLTLFFCSFPMLAGFIAIALWAVVSLLRFTAESRQSAFTADTITYRKAERNKPKK